MSGPKDTTGLAWNGAPKPKRSGGFVGSVGLNQPTTLGLAVDPNGTTGVDRHRTERPPGGGRRGTQVTIKTIVDPDGPIAPNGRVRLP